MAFFDTDSAWQLGVQTMDFEHGRLVKQMNDLHARCSAKAPRPIVARVLQALYDGTLAHFRHEEAHMRQHRHPGYDAHRRIHAQLMQTLTQFRDAFVKDGAELDRDFFDFLEQWLCAHLLEVDASYARDVAA